MNYIIRMDSLRTPWNQPMINYMIFLIWKTGLAICSKFGFLLVKSDRIQSGMESLDSTKHGGDTRLAQTKKGSIIKLLSYCKAQTSIERSSSLNIVCKYQFLNVTPSLSFESDCSSQHFWFDWFYQKVLAVWIDMIRNCHTPYRKIQIVCPKFGHPVQSLAIYLSS